MITLSELEAAYKVTKARSTPHRHPAFALIRKECDNDDPDVNTMLVFVEEHNTGYDGVLHRYMCRVEPSVMFQIDLLPGMIVAEPSDERQIDQARDEANS
jgi:hypothetical protein